MHNKEKKIWFVDIKSMGSSKDLRKMIPILAFVAKDFIERDSDFEREIKLKSNDRELKDFLSSIGSN